MKEKMQLRPVCNKVYIASCTENGGIFRYSLYNDGSLSFIDKIQADRVMYMIAENGILYTVLRAPFPGLNESGLAAYKITVDGSLLQKSGAISTKGEVACHLTMSIPEQDIFCANYISGSVFKSDGTLVVHSGSSQHRMRQASPHTHCTVFTPDGRYLCVTDLGIDKIVIYDKDLKLVSQCSLPAGNGPRHLVFSPDNETAFCINELSSTVSLLKYAAGKLNYINDFTAFPKDYDGESAAAAIRISSDGKYLYTSNRGHDSISCFKVRNDELELFDIVPSGGNSPRDFNISPDGRWLLCANEGSDNVISFRINEDGSLLKKTCITDLKSPLCVVFGG